ncbi:TlpA disulfide reductase family protein [Sphingobacterium yanglingense]|uniref:Thiol-disulfide isomerase/thioredoxin n=1 Tax=Sphingobacterium yanglingense TaxID=1437280 RepID=A0A4R6WCG2_9SPHI|nr:TlpA disulfide reductase family protein [Sphingobacterium yanglingense]TDQ75434.1 thiol-disulfide isomerase/thioredoxin [Sphingobacterium yanglingense]
MNRLFTVALLLLSMGSYAQEKYTITGNIAGEVEGNKVYLYKNDYAEDVKVDSAVIKNGTFKFVGSVPSPMYYRIIIDRTLKGKTSYEKNWTSTHFYLENSPITIEAHIDSMSTYYHNPKKKAATVTGSKTEDEYTAFKESLKEERAQMAALYKDYMEKYHLPTMDGVFNTEEGIRLTKAMQPVEQKIKAATLAFIRANPNSVVAYDQARMNFLGMFVELTVDQISDLQQIVKKGWDGTDRYTNFIELSEKAKKTALHTKYQDFELLTPEGNKMKISSLVPKGEYCMLEFWASWCGPCRGEIPHLVKINEKYKDAGFKIISISIDEKDAQWRKAMEEEKMTWTQLNDPNGFNGEITKAYNIQGIPFAILLDPEGRIVDFNMRGCKLDVALLDIYGY